MTLTVAVDIGGTHIRVAAYEPNSTIPVAHQRTKTLASTPGVFERLVQTIESVWQKGNVTSIGIASPKVRDEMIDICRPKERVDFPGKDQRLYSVAHDLLVAVELVHGGTSSA